MPTVCDSSLIQLTLRGLSSHLWEHLLPRVRTLLAVDTLSADPLCSLLQERVPEADSGPTHSESQRGVPTGLCWHWPEGKQETRLGEIAWHKAPLCFPLMTPESHGFDVSQHLYPAQPDSSLFEMEKPFLPGPVVLPRGKALVM